MKNILFSIGFLVLSSNLFAQKYLTRTGKISFFSGTPVENIEAFNNDVAAAIDAADGSVMFIVPIKSFKFDKALMQEHFNDNYMESDKYPKANFKGNITNIKAVDFSKNGTYKVTVSGKLTMHGVTKTVSIPGSIVMNGGKATINAKFNVNVDDYKIDIPSVSKDKIAKSIEVTVYSILEKK